MIQQVPHWCVVTYLFHVGVGGIRETSVPLCKKQGVRLFIFSAAEGSSSEHQN